MRRASTFRRAPDKFSIHPSGRIGVKRNSPRKTATLTDAFNHRLRPDGMRTEIYIAIDAARAKNRIGPGFRSGGPSSPHIISQLQERKPNSGRSQLSPPDLRRDDILRMGEIPPVPHIMIYISPSRETNPPTIAFNFTSASANAIWYLRFNMPFSYSVRNW